MAGFELVSKYTSDEAVEDGFLFDLDLLVKAGLIRTASQLPIKYITTSVLDLGYWKEPCEHHIKRENIGLTQACRDCKVFKKYYSSAQAVIPCSEHDKQELNMPNVRDLIVAALKIFNKKPQDDYFVSGRIELPSGDKQEVYIAQNETGRYTLMLPEDY